MTVDALLALMCLGAFSGLVLLAAACDIASMEIPNWISIALAAFFPLAALHGGWTGNAIAIHLGVGLFMFMAGFGLFSLGLLGGGDVKVIAGASVWTGFAGLPAFLFYMSVAGGALAFAMLLARRLATPGDTQPAFLNRLLNRANGIPYAVAIAAGALAALPSNPLALALFNRASPLIMP